MIKISLKALVSLLVDNGLFFQIEKNEDIEERRVINLAVDKGYPKTDTRVISDYQNWQSLYKPKSDGYIILIYDIDNSHILAATYSVLCMIKKAISQAANKNIQEIVNI